MRLLLIVCGLVVVACPSPDPGPEAEVNIGIRGLWSNPNDLEAPRGALATADNIVIDRPDVAEPRRGFGAIESSPSITGPINAMVIFGTYLIAHHSTGSVSRINWDDPDTWTTYSGTFSPPDSSTPVTFLEGEGSLFMTTAAGVYELETPTGAWRKTGAPPGLDGTAAINRTSGTAGWSTPDGQWAYRDLWVYRNAANRLQFGAPSGRMIMVNPAAVTVAIGSLARAGTTVTATVSSHPFATNDVVDLSPGEANFAAGQKTITGTTSTTFTYTEAGLAVVSTAQQSFSFATRLATRTVRIPSEITSSSGWVLQVYRSAKSATAAAQPDDSMGLVVEKAPTNLEIAAGAMTVTDYAPDNLRGATLYTTISGLVAAKDQPPVCHDISSYRQSYWCADTNRNHRLSLQLLAIGGASGLAVNDAVVLRSVVSRTAGAAYYKQQAITAATAENAGAAQFKRYTTGSAAQNIEDTAQSLVRVINAVSGALFNAYYVSSDTDFPGQILVQVRDPAKGQFVATLLNATGSAFTTVPFAPDLSVLIEVDDLSRSGSTVTLNTLGSHGLAAGQQFTLESTSVAADAAFPEGVKTVATVPSSTQITYTEAGAAVTNSATYQIFDPPLSLTASQNDDWSNSLHYSSPDEPWSFPVAQQFFVGSRGTTIYRLIPTADRLLIWTSNGVYKVTGTFPFFSVSEVDADVKLLARGLAASLGDRGYGYTEEGFVEVLDSAVVRSLPIERTLRELQAGAPGAVSAESFAVAYKSDRRLLAWMPSQSSDTYATQAFVYHKDSTAWTRWPVNATCGIIHPTQDKLYLGMSDGAVWVEHKSRAVTDHQDPGGVAITSTVEWLAQVDPVDATKFWYEGSLDFKTAQFTTSTLYFASDLAPSYDAGTTMVPPLGEVTTSTRIPFWVSMEKRRGARLRVKFVHATAAKSFALQGLKLSYRVTSETKSGR